MLIVTVIHFVKLKIDKKSGFQEELGRVRDISTLTSCFCHWLPILAPHYEKYCSNFSKAIKTLQVN